MTAADASARNGSIAPVLPATPEPEPPREVKADPKSAVRPEGEGTQLAAKQTRQKFPFRLPLKLLDELRDAAVHLGRPMNRIGIEALERELEELRREVTGGEPFPKRPHEPRPGRPIA